MPAAEWSSSPRPPPPTTSAVIVHYRSEASIEACVAALTTQSRPPDELVVVCNSPIEAALAHRLAQAGVRLVHSPSNVGFGAACNAGARVATGEYLLFVNPDVRCSPDAVEALARAAASGAVVGPAIRGADGRPERSVKSRAYVSPSVMLAREVLLGRWLRLGSPRLPRGTAEVDALSGACLMMRRDAFDALGGFDERYFLYGEDVDLSLRAARLGIPRVYEPAATVVHASGTGGGGARPDHETLAIKGREVRRAHALLLEAHRGPQARRRYVVGLAPVLRLRALAARVAGNDAEAVRARAALDWLSDGSGTPAPAGGGRRVAVVTNGAHATGAPRSLLSILRRAPAHVQVDLACIGAGPLLGELREATATLEVIPAPRTRGITPARLREEWQAWAALRRWGDRHRESLLLVNTVDYEAALLLARRRAGSSAVAIRETTAYLAGPRGRARSVLLAAKGLRLAGVGEAQVDAWREALGRPIERLVNVYEQPPTRPAGGLRRPVPFLFVGGRSPTKGLDLVLAAFERADLGDAAVLLVASGDFSPKEQGSVRWLGYVPDLDARVGELADFLVGGSRRETFSRTAVVAALAGVPLVAWRTGGYIEQVERVGGWLVEPFDVDALAGCLRTLAHMPDAEYAGVSCAVRERAQRWFDPAAAAVRWWDWILGEGYEERQ